MRTFPCFVSLFAIALTPACGGKVVVEQPTGGGGSGGAPTSSSSGFVTTATGSDTTTVSGVAVSSSAVTTGVSGGPGMCTNPADLAIIQGKDVWGVLVKCTMQFLGKEPAQEDCIFSNTGLSMGCTVCYDDYATCSLKNCINQCAPAPNSPACASCRAMFCDGAFEMCSGLATAPGP
jgi:hypothetical protein